MDPSKLRDRLRGVIAPVNPGGAPPARHEERRLEAQSIESALGGEWRHDDRGRSFVVTRRYAPERQYGRSTVGGYAGALHAASRAAALVGGQPAAAPFVFLDLETTGLSGGAGTQAFIVGCGWFDEDGAFVTSQHLLVAPSGERDMLRRVTADVERGPSVVTFNGKSFDAPVIETRYLFHRMTSPCVERPHVDLVHPARRFWSAAIPSCTLTTLETEVLGVTRTGDVPGFEIPARYFAFVRSGDARPLAAVLEHNRLDLLSLAGLAAHLFRLVDEGPAAARHAQEALALGRVYERAGLDERAERAYQEAVTRARGVAQTRPGELPVDARRLVQREALRALALNARRARRYETAASLWRELLEMPGCPRELAREATEALAIHHEHRVRDLATAKWFALKSLEGATAGAWGDAVRHRLARLDRKLLSERPLFPSSSSQPSFAIPTSAPRTSS